MRITCGKPVADLIAPSKETPGPLSAIPWSDSDHHSYDGIPSLGTAEALLDSCWIFSSNVRSETRNRALDLVESDVLQKG